MSAAGSKPGGRIRSACIWRTFAIRWSAIRCTAGAGESLKTLLREFPRQALHAHKLRFDHPVSGAPVECKAPLPDDMFLLLDALREDQESD